jgi:Co/Zn/Cd efflux system component
MRKAMSARCSCDAANYALSLAAVAAGSLWASRAALAKGLTMGAYGMGVLAFAAWRLRLGAPPEPMTMGIVGALALATNLGVAWLLYAYRNGDANMRSVWLCTRNDAISNLAVLAAAAGVFGTSSVWPDVAVAAIMAGLALSSARSVIARALGELRVVNAARAD